MNNESNIFVLDDEYTIDCIEKRKNELSTTVSNAIKELDNFNDSNISVFISSTKTDLEEERWAVSELVDKMGFDKISMEHFGARTENPLETCLSELQKANIYVCILGMRYGSLYINKKDRENNGLSYTEIEYNHVHDKVKEQGIRILIYCIDEEHAKIHPIYVDKHGRATKLEKFKNKIKQEHVIYSYKSTEDLIHRLALNLQRDALSILSKRKELLNDISDEKRNESGSIIFTSDIESAYVYQPIRISGKTANINNTKIYLYLTKKQASFPPEDSSIIPLTNTIKHITIPLNKNGSWAHTLYLNNLGQKLSNGEYSLLAVSSPDLSLKNIAYASSSIILRNGFIVLNYVDEVLTRGLPFTIKGMALTAKPFLYLWVCSDSKIYAYLKINVNKNNGDFTYTFPDELVNLLSDDRQYFGIVNMPTNHEKGDLWLDNNNNPQHICSSQKTISLEGIESVAFKICEMLDEVGGLYAKFTFISTEPRILTPPSKTLQVITNPFSVLTISKDTNLPNGTLVVADILYKDSKNLNGNYKLIVSLTTITSGSSNKSSFSVSFDTTSFQSGEYISRVRLASNNKILSVEKWIKL